MRATITLLAAVLTGCASGGSRLRGFEVIDLACQPLGRPESVLRVTARAADGTPVTGASVTVEGGDHWRQAATTGADGRVEVPLPGAGPYEVELSATGSGPVKVRDVNVPAGCLSGIRLALPATTAP